MPADSGTFDVDCPFPDDSSTEEFEANLSTYYHNDSPPRFHHAHRMVHISQENNQNKNPELKCYLNVQHIDVTTTLHIRANKSLNAFRLRNPIIVTG
ncbi:unnamed protein product [Strongylus vulgaris]|uniref:Uncharacterized protein n=1 Tax=Strongylus vulgaris TaxID=40348 RepID=A0A3P7IWD1_STRVU|nr:unnamed protein product [Strongylus vulgaris]